MKAKTKLTKLWSILLVLVMVVGMLPTVALAAEPATKKADFSVDPTAALALLNNAKTGTADSTWDPDTNTLTLNGVDFTTTASTAVKLPEAAIIVLNGDNIITGGEAMSKDSFGIYALGDLTIKGAGKLTVTSGSAYDDSHGIYAKGRIAISDNADVIATSGTANDNSYGIHAMGRIAISGTAKVNATGGKATNGSSCGIDATNDLSISGTATVTATGGTATNGSSCGIDATNDLSISGTATVTATGGTAGRYSYGINVLYNTMSISGGTVYAEGGAAGYYSYGIYAYVGLTISGDADVTAKGGTAADGSSYGLRSFGNVTISGTAKVKATGGTAKNGSYGIDSQTTIDISGGTVNATGGEAGSGYDSCGIYANNGNVIISGGTITATGGTSGRASLGIYSKGNFTISGTADVTGKGGTATGDGSFGINAEGEVIISGGKVKAIGGAGKGSDGLYSGNGQINISGGKVEAFGGDAPSAGGSFGIFAQTSGANVTITGTADVTARGGESASDRSYGIYSRNPVTISGGKVEAFGGEGCYPGYGINKANISGGTVTAASEYGDAINNVTTGSGFKTISFDRNGGSGEMIAYTNADSYILPANGFTAPADKEFMGWSESSTGDVIEDTTVNATDGKTLYAIWKINVADFNADPTAALALLNATKTGTADSEWNSSTNTLTLNGVNFETTAATAVRLPADSTIILNGVNTIKGGDSDSSKCYGIYALGKLTIQGSGTLNVTGGATTGYYSSYGIYASRDLTIKSGTVIATGGTVSQDYNSHGIFVYSGYVTIESGTVIATGGRAGEDSCGINSDYVNIKGGKVEATGGTAGRDSYGIYLYENITIEGGTVIAKAEDRALNMSPHTLPDTYQWRTSESGAYNKYPDSAYTWNAAHTYLEIKKLEYTVTFDANGGTGTMADVTDVLGDYTLPENSFTAPEGKQFKCWSVDGIEKAVGDKITVSADTTVKAVWENITYTVSFDSNGGTGTMTAQTGVLGDYTLPANGFTAPEGKQFKCWSVNGAEKAVGATINVTANTTVTAVWETIPATATEYDILDGANSSWTQNSDGSLSIRGSGAFSEFVGVKVDGKSVDEKYYTVKEGSTIVTLKADYLNTLTVGSHTLEIVWTDGSASTIFTIEAESPQTGDNSMMALWIAVLFVSGFGVVATAVYGKKRKSVK